MNMLAAGDSSHYEKRLRPRGNRVRQRRVGRLVGQIFLAGEEAQERSALLGDVVANRPTQHGISGFKCIEDRAQRGPALDFELHFAANVRQRPQMLRKHDPNHGSVCTSTESTAGRSRTMGAQLSPASDDAYTCPPVVPKYTPQESSESTAIASRSTLT